MDDIGSYSFSYEKNASKELVLDQDDAA